MIVPNSVGIVGAPPVITEKRTVKIAAAAKTSNIILIGCICYLTLLPILR